MHLFAIVANSEEQVSDKRKIVELFLKQQLSQSLLEKYLSVYDEFYALHRGKAEAGRELKRTSVQSVKVLRICTDINRELNQKQKYVVLARLIEFIYASSEIYTEQSFEFAQTVAEVFNISPDEYRLLATFADPKKQSFPGSPLLLCADNKNENQYREARHLRIASLQGELWFMHLKPAGIFLTKYCGEDDLTINSQQLTLNRLHVFSHGSVIRSAKTEPVYFSEVLGCFSESVSQSRSRLDVNEIEYRFANNKTGLHRLSFSLTSGNLVAIMGGSGAGKSTLLNVLNGNYTPSSGEVTVNGINLHRQKKKLEGVIGYIPQDDLLIEELTVFQNLYFNYKLCSAGEEEKKITARVEAMLESIGLAETRDLKVGNALSKTISGGQRKRLNIALELLREPEILFVDEPTSGLSSRDSENVMDLLKQLSQSGKLVMVVIHQPSSDIFKLFDKLLLLDNGGYPVYSGYPADSLIYFKKHAGFANADESECLTCGNINPELIFSILETRVMDEYGVQQKERKISPEEWYKLFKERNSDAASQQPGQTETPVQKSRKPGWAKQFAVFFQRDVLSKLSNRQYLLISFLEAPLLAFILSFLIRYTDPNEEYVFRNNPNLPAYLFMAVIVALFIGMMVSAEEIFRDRKLLRRESFLNLSRSSYLSSKISVLFLLSAIQSIMFVWIGNFIMEIKMMNADYWLVVFSLFCFANMLGLNISSAFDSAVAIYIIIPLLIIPQILLSGVIVKFSKLNPVITTQSTVPLLGEMMASRWAYEALAVHQYKDNAYEKNFFVLDKRMSEAQYHTKFRISRMEDKLIRCNELFRTNTSHPDYAKSLEFLRNELQNLYSEHHALAFQQVDLLSPGNFNLRLADDVKQFLGQLRKEYIEIYNASSAEKDRKIISMQNSNGAEEINRQRQQFTNEALDDMVLNKNDRNQVVEDNNSLVRFFQPVYMDGDKNSFVRANFYASRKNLFGNFFDTYWVNIGMIWLMAIVLAITLHFNLLRKLVNLRFK